MSMPLLLTEGRILQDTKQSFRLTLELENNELISSGRGIDTHSIQTFLTARYKQNKKTFSDHLKT